MNLKPIVISLVTLTCWVSAEPRLLAQNVVGATEVLANDRPEAWAMKLTGSELMMTTGVARPVKPWSIQLGLETGWIPSLNEEQRLIGFNGIKRENVNRTSAYARPLVLIGLPAQVSLELGYIPPVRLGGVRPNHLAWSLARPIVSRSWWRVGGRVHGQIGHLDGDLTCDKETVAAGEDPIRNPYGCQARSKDEMRLRSVGLELGSAFQVTRRFEPYIAAGWNYFDNEFQVNARYSGSIDNTLLLSSGPTFSLTGGISYRLSERIDVRGDMFYTPLQVQRHGTRMGDDLFNVRISIFYHLR
jgi:hypothetical protein